MKNANGKFSMRKETTLKLVLTAMFTALTTVATVAITIPLPTGYLNFGDTIILIAATMLGPIAGAFVGGIGACIADLIVYPPYALATFIIKGIEGFLCGITTYYIIRSNLKRPAKLVLVGLVSLISALLMMLGYFCADIIIGGIGAATASVVGNTIQAVVSFAVSIAVIGALFKTKLFNGYFYSTRKINKKQAINENNSTACEEVANNDSEISTACEEVVDNENNNSENN